MNWRRHAPRLFLTLLPLLLALGHITGVARLPFVDSLEAFVYDVRLRATLPGTPDPRIVIVDIDDASLQRFGQWPWGRDRLANFAQELIERQRVGALGFDVMFVEDDRSSGEQVLRSLRRAADGASPALVAELDRLSGHLDHDQRFADALKGGPVVLGFYFTNSPDGRSQGGLPPPVLPQGLLPEGADQVPHWNSYGASLPVLAAVAPAGFLNMIIDPRADGVVRSVPLLARHAPGPAGTPGGSYYESLALALYRQLVGAPPPVARTGPAGGGAPPRLQSLLLQSSQGQRVVPVDASAHLHVPYRGPGGRAGGTFRYVSAIDVLEGRLAEGELAGKAVLVGTSAPGLRDLRSTPVSADYPGVEIHASVLSALLDGRFLTVPDYAPGAAAAAVLLLLGGLAIGQLLLPSRVAIGIVAAGTLGLMAADHLLFVRHGLILPLAAVMLSVGLALALNLGWGYFVETRTRRGLAQLFGSYVPPPLVREMLRDPTRYTMRAESKELTVMFCDMRDFTRLSEGMSPAQLQPLLNRVFSRLTAVISRHRGTVDKYMGDCVMAFWGAPLDAPRHASLAVQAALDIVDAVAALNAELRREGLPGVQVGIGLNTGMMHVGDMGSALRRSYTVIGDAVNLAARLEGLGEHYGVNIVAGPDTRARATDFHWQELDHVRVKGKQHAVSIFTPRAEGADPRRLGQELRRWEALRSAYRARDWGQALTLLDELRAADDEKVLYRLYAKRLASLTAHPPGPDWDGTEQFESK